jgi:Fe2+ transport system protein FeoA
MITTLEKVKAGASVVVRGVNGGRGIRRRLAHVGIHPLDKVEVIRSGMFGGPVLIKVHGVEVGIGHGMAEKVEVEMEDSH